MPQCSQRLLVLISCSSNVCDRNRLPERHPEAPALNFAEADDPANIGLGNFVWNKQRPRFQDLVRQMLQIAE